MNIRINAISTLDDLDGYLANRQDVVDGDYGVPEPNEEMILLRELRTTRTAVANLVKAAKDAAWLLQQMDGMTRLPEVKTAIERELTPLIAALTQMEAPRDQDPRPGSPSPQPTGAG